MEKLAELYRGKAKTLYQTSDPNFLVLAFRDDTSAFNGLQMQKLAQKGIVNNKFNYFIMTILEKVGIPTQIEKLLSDSEVLVKKLQMIPVECVIRNRSAGSLVKRLGIPEGEILSPPVFELFLKNDTLQDPMINESHCGTLNLATTAQLNQMRALSVKINRVLSDLFDKAGFILVDFKLEFGLVNETIILGDEFSPDGCRLWEKNTLKKMDKDRFRHGLGEVIESYEIVAKRIGVPL